MTRAFIGQPADDHGNVLPCVRCDKGALMRVGNEPRCGRHINEAIPAIDKLRLTVERRREERNSA